MADRLRQATRTGRPFGDQDFTRAMEGALGRTLGPAKRGPKARAQSVAAGGQNFEVA